MRFDRTVALNCLESEWKAFNGDHCWCKVASNFFHDHSLTAKKIKGPVHVRGGSLAYITVRLAKTYHCVCTEGRVSVPIPTIFLII